MKNPENVPFNKIKKAMNLAEEAKTFDDFKEIAESLQGITRGHQIMIYQYAGLHIASLDFSAIEVKEIEMIFKSNMVQ